MVSGRPVRIPPALIAALTSGAGAPTLPRDDDLPTAPDVAAVEHRVVIQPSHLDHVVHVNNGIYADFLEDGAFALFAAHGWSFARMFQAGGALRVRQLDCEYLADARAGDSVVVRSWLLRDSMAAEAQPEDASLLQTISRDDGTPLLRAQTDWVWRYKPAIVGGAPQ